MLIGFNLPLSDPTASPAIGLRMVGAIPPYNRGDIRWRLGGLETGKSEPAVPQIRGSSGQSPLKNR